MKRGPHDQTILRHLATNHSSGSEQTFRLARKCGLECHKMRPILKRLERYGLVDRPPNGYVLNPWWRITEAGRAELTI